MISVRGKDYFLGDYQLSCDAAMAHDKAALSLGPHWRLNFATYQEYTVVREMEKKRNRLVNNVKSMEKEIASRVKEVVAKVSTLVDPVCDVKAWVSVPSIINCWLCQIFDLKPSSDQKILKATMYERIH